VIDRIVTFEASPVVVEELICVDGLPLGIREAIAENGMLHPAITKHQKLAREIRLGVDGCFVKRYLLQPELAAIAAAQEKS
jgi:hypothetical protein